jgi:hypothetical protein
VEPGFLAIGGNALKTGESDLVFKHQVFHYGIHLTGSKNPLTAVTGWQSLQSHSIVNSYCCHFFEPNLSYSCSSRAVNTEKPWFMFLKSFNT